MAGKAQRTIRIKWVRSTIGFTRRQRAMVRSLGLRRLNQVVERQDSPQIRGVMANIPHLVEIVEGTPPVLWTSIPEYTVRPPEGQPTRVPLASSEVVAAKGPAKEKEEVEVTIAEPVPQKAAKSSVATTSKAAKAAKSQKPARQATSRTKSAKARAAKKQTQAKPGVAKKARPSKKEK